jgi:hypothetical protein
MNLWYAWLFYLMKETGIHAGLTCSAGREVMPRERKGEEEERGEHSR